MKKFLTLLVIVTITFLANAQTDNTGIIHGAVVDQNGNPLVGAQVTATGGAETTLVESDGSFTLEVPIWLKSVTASYAGYQNKKMKTSFNKDMIFRMSPKQKYWFLNLTAGYSFDSGGYHSSMLGLMGGMLKNWGFYGKILLPIGHMEEMILSYFTVGVTKKIYKNFYCYLGMGYGGIGWIYYSSDYEYIGVEGGFAAELGFILKIGRHLDITAGYGMTHDFYSDYNHLPSISVGYVF